MKRTIRLSLVALALLAGVAALAQAQTADTRRVPTVDDLMTLKSVGSPRISPDGTRVAYTVTETDFDQDAYVTQIWLADAATGRRSSSRAARSPRSGPSWSPDGRWLAFTSSRVDDKSQIFVISPDGGEAIQLTKAETGVNGYDWSPDGKTIAFTAGDPASDESKDRKDFYGDFEVVRREYTHSHLWTVDVAEALSAPQPGRRRTSGKAFTVGGFDWSPDGDEDRLQRDGQSRPHQRRHLRHLRPRPRRGRGQEDRRPGRPGLLPSLRPGRAVDPVLDRRGPP